MPEITLSDDFGKAIVATIRAFRVQRVIEIGSWDGAGSTSVLLSALAEVPDHAITCVEPNEWRHSQLRDRVAGMPWITTVCARSVSRENMTPKTFEDVWQSPHNRLPYSEEVVREWWDAQADGPSYLDWLQGESWDAALIDGCEFSGWDDYRLLRRRVRVLMLDDAYRAYKCAQAHDDLRGRPEWACVWCSAFVRNGASIWVRP